MSQNRKRALFLLGRDPRHPGAAGGDLQGWVWARWLAEHAWDVEVVAQSFEAGPGTETVDGVQVVRLGRGPWLSLATVIRYWPVRRRIDLVYEDPIGGGRMPYFAPLWFRGPTIAVWHQVSEDLLRAVYRPPVAWALSRLEVVIAQLYRRAQLWAPSTRSASEVARRLRIPREQISVVHPTIPTELEIATAPRPAGRYFLAMGVIRPYKNFHHAIEALAYVRAAGIDVSLVIAGRHFDEAYEDRLLQLAERLDLADHVEFQYGVSDAERQRLMASAIALLLPSSVEGFGIVSIEANAEGTPVIASSGVPEEAVAHEVNGLRFEHADVSGLGGAMARIARDADLRDTLARGSLEHARSLTVSAMAPRFEAVVARAMHG